MDTTRLQIASNVVQPPLKLIRSRPIPLMFKITRFVEQPRLFPADVMNRMRLRSACVCRGRAASDPTGGTVARIKNSSFGSKCVGASDE